MVLKRTNYGEADRILVMLSRHHGKLSAIAKGVRKTTSRKAPHVEPYSLAKLYFAATRGMPIVTQAETIHRFGDTQLDLAVASLAFQLGEVVLEFLPEDEPHPAVFDQLHRSLVRLTQTEPHEAIRVAEQFQRFLLTELGFGQPPEEVNLVDHIERLLDRRLKSAHLGDLTT